MASFLSQIQAKIFLLLLIMLLYNCILIVLEGGFTSQSCFQNFKYCYVAINHLCYPIYPLPPKNFVCYNMVWSKLQWHLLPIIWRSSDRIRPQIGPRGLMLLASELDELGKRRNWIHKCVTEQNRWSLKVNFEKYLTILKAADITAFLFCFVLLFTLKICFMALLLF